MVLLKEMNTGSHLAVQLRKQRLERPVVVAMSPGGVRLGWDIASELRLPMDVLMAHEVVVPGYRQVRIGGVAGGVFLPDQEALRSENLPAEYIERLAARVIRRQETQDQEFRRGQPALNLLHCGVVLVDDGWSCPVAVHAAVEALAQRGASGIIFASPRCGDEIHQRLEGKAGIVTRYPRETRHSVLVGDRSLASVTLDEAAEWVAASRQVPSPEALPSLLERMPVRIPLLANYSLSGRPGSRF